MPCMALLNMYSDNEDGRYLRARARACHLRGLDQPVEHKPLGCESVQVRRERAMVGSYLSTNAARPVRPPEPFGCISNDAARNYSACFIPFIAGERRLEARMSEGEDELPSCPQNPMNGSVGRRKVRDVHQSQVAHDDIESIRG